MVLSLAVSQRPSVLRFHTVWPLLRSTHFSSLSVAPMYENSHMSSVRASIM
jgi:hypothetical protein